MKRPHLSPKGFLAGVVVLVAVVSLAVAFDFYMQSRADGINGPGCDWGHPKCDVTDYQYNCANLDPTPLQQKRYCDPIVNGRTPGQPPWAE